MTFLFREDTKYAKWYFSIVDSAKLRGTGEERHHIVPRSLGGNDSKTNIVLLTRREHFVCHALLFRMCVGESRRKMATAYVLMGGRTQNARIYEVAKKEHAAHVSAKMRGYKHSTEAKRKMSETRTGVSAVWNIGRKRTDMSSAEGRAKLAASRKGLVWWNNGEISITSKISPGEEWKRGRLPFKPRLSAVERGTGLKG